jgi:hypothetical protein
MVALVAAETALLALLVILVAGLLRSHAEILRRLGQPGETVPPPPDHSRPAGAPAPELAGVTPDGDAIRLAFDGNGASPTLLAFLTTGCTTCAGFWETLAEPRLPPEVRTVIVARGSDRERVSKLRSLAPPGVPVVMSSPAWEDYQVPGSPYFVLVDGTIRGEGAATTWQAVASLVGDAIDEQRRADSAGLGAPRGSDAAPPVDLDATFAAAGIGPEHPSLRPGGHA